MDAYHLKVRRGDQKDSYWEHFEVPVASEGTLIDLLEAIRRNPVDQKKRRTSPVNYESGCKAGLCDGSCMALVDGHPQALCRLRVGLLPKSFTLEPLSSYPVFRDLIVDKSRLWEEECLLDAAPPLSDFRFKGGMQEFKRISLSGEDSCLDCGACLEACPRSPDRPRFGGARLALKGLNLMKSYPERENALMNTLLDELDMGACDNAMACVKACPQGIALDAVWGQFKRKVSRHFFKSFLG